MRWALLLALLASPAQAQTDPCPFYDGRRIFKDWRPLSQLLVAQDYRKECGVSTEADARAIHSVHEARGCPVESAVGQYFADILEAPVTPDNEHPGLAALRRSNLTGYAQFCRMADYLTWPEGDASFLVQKPGTLNGSQLATYQAFWSHLDAMQGELTRMMTELGRLP